jgi:hypothetical protein
MIPGAVAWSRPRTPVASEIPMISTTEPSGRLVTLPAFGRFTGSACVAGDHAVERERDELA